MSSVRDLGIGLAVCTAFVAGYVGLKVLKADHTPAPVPAPTEVVASVPAIEQPQPAAPTAVTQPAATPPAASPAPPAAPARPKRLKRKPFPAKPVPTSACAPIRRDWAKQPWSWSCSLRV